MLQEVCDGHPRVDTVEPLFDGLLGRDRALTHELCDGRDAGNDLGEGREVIDLTRASGFRGLNLCESIAFFEPHVALALDGE